MIEIACLCDILHVKHKKLPFIAILTLFLILGKIQDGSQDGQHCWWRHRPQAAPPPMKYTSSWWEEQRLSSKSKIVSKYCNLSKTLGGGPSTNYHPPSPLYYDGGINLRVRPRVKKELFCFKMKACRERAFTFSIKILWRVTYHCSRLSAIVKSDKSVCFYCIDIHGENRLHDHHWTIFVVLAGDPVPWGWKLIAFYDILNHFIEKVKSAITYVQLILKSWNKPIKTLIYKERYGWLLLKKNWIASCKPLSWNLCNVRPSSNVEFYMCRTAFFVV